MKKLSVCLLVCALLLSACSITLPSSQARDERIRNREKALNAAVSVPQPDTSGSGAVSMAATTVPVQTATIPAATAAPETMPPAKENPVTSVKFTRKHTSDGYEYATIQGLSGNGKEVWKYTTGQYPVAQLYQTYEIGRWQDRYYFGDGEAVVAIDINDGHILWQNHDFYGTAEGDCAVIGSTGNLYLTGYLGPDFIAIDHDGYTLKLAESISSEYFWPCRLEVDETNRRATVYMSSGSEGYIGEENPHPLTVYLP